MGGKTERDFEHLYMHLLQKPGKAVLAVSKRNGSVWTPAGDDMLSVRARPMRTLLQRETR